jgi:hypothetical protein
MGNTYCNKFPGSIFTMELGGQKFSTDTKVKQATTIILCKMSGNGLLHVFEKWVGRCKKCKVCEGYYFKKETVPKPQESSDCK